MKKDIARQPGTQKPARMNPKRRVRLLLTLAITLPILSLLAGAAVAALQYGAL